MEDFQSCYSTSLGLAFLGEIEESEGVRGSRALFGDLTCPVVEIIRTMDDAVFEMVWDENLVHTMLSLLTSLYILIFLFASYRLVGSIRKVLSDDGESPASQRSLASMAESLGRMAVFVIGAFVIAGVVGFDLNEIIAGLGITGLALALAAKDTVSNMFGAVSIIIEPFNLGDWIKVDGIEGRWSILD